ncbi:hypothetical protein AM1_6302 [Acaryochloris marina MBIC11017]|uniref:Uncharacterized protein n=1 Tax=Acaryochloris marina (strain MBIC 11017) TaxID=329726 RepID=B0C7E8_ACAM1|nr:hypothetical protein AM1_6302 [Acaryochloris marina MBIC11017]
MQHLRQGILPKVRCIAGLQISKLCNPWFPGTRKIDDHPLLKSTGQY